MSDDLHGPEQIPGEVDPPLLPQHRELSDGEQYLVLHERLATTAWQVAQRYFGASPRFDDAIDEIVHEALVETVARWRRVRRRGNPAASVALAVLKGCQQWSKTSSGEDSSSADSDSEGDGASAPVDDWNGRAEATDLDHLTPAERDIVVLRDWVGIAEGDVCLFLGISHEKLTQRSLSAAAKLRDVETSERSG